MSLVDVGSAILGRLPPDVLNRVVKWLEGLDGTPHERQLNEVERISLGEAALEDAERQAARILGRDKL
jgi:hypothetical protein